MNAYGRRTDSGCVERSAPCWVRNAERDGSGRPIQAKFLPIILILRPDDPNGSPSGACGHSVAMMKPCLLMMTHTCPQWFPSATRLPAAHPLPTGPQQRRVLPSRVLYLVGDPEYQQRFLSFRSWMTYRALGQGLL